MKNVIRPEMWFSLSLLIMLASFSAAQTPQAQPDQPAMKLPTLLTAKPSKVDPSDDELRKLQKSRYNEAVGEVKGLLEMYVIGRSGIDLFAEASQRLVRAGLELHDKPAEKVTLLMQYVELTKEVEKLAQARHDAGKAFISELHRARYQRLDAEIQLLRFKREAVLREQSDLQKLVGRWLAVSAEHKGAKLADVDLKAIVSELVFARDNTVTRRATESSTKSKFTIASGQVPGMIGFEKAPWSLGIYELEADTLKLCIPYTHTAVLDGIRATGTDGKDPNGLLIIFKRGQSSPPPEDGNEQRAKADGVKILARASGYV